MQCTNATPVTLLSWRNTCDRREREHSRTRKTTRGQTWIRVWQRNSTGMKILRQVAKQTEKDRSTEPLAPAILPSLNLPSIHREIAPKADGLVALKPERVILSVMLREVQKLCNPMIPFEYKYPTILVNDGGLFGLLVHFQVDRSI